MKEQALKYLSNNLSVIPVGDDKLPLISWKEFQSRLPTREEVEGWWTQFPNANIAIITGKISGIIVVDVEKGGDTSKLPITSIAKTGGGGWHYYYKYVRPFRNKTRIFELTDIRADGGYVVAPPSKHKSGNCYEWTYKEEFNPFPYEMFETNEIELKDWKQISEGTTQGNRNDTATSYCGKLMRLNPPDFWESVVWNELKRWNGNNKPPLEEKELRIIFESVARNAVNDPRKQSVEDKVENVEFITYSDVLEEGYNELINTKPSDVLSFGYDWLDAHLTGIFPSELIVVGGESGTGKTTFCTNIIYKASKEHKCAMYALEDRLEDYAIKALYFKVGQVKREKEGRGIDNYSWNDYRRNSVNDSKFEEYLKIAKEQLKNDNIQFAKIKTMLDIDLLEKLIEKQVEQGIELFLIDHLHYFDLYSKDDNKANYIENVMIRLKTLQRKTGARIILVVHYRKLNGQKPTLDSFKDSISIVQNANYVINIWRDRVVNDYNKLATEEEKMKADNEKHFKTYFFIPKARNPNGEGTVEVEFDPTTGDYKPILGWKFGTNTNLKDNETKLDEIEF